MAAFTDKDSNEILRMVEGILGHPFSVSNSRDHQSWRHGYAVARLPRTGTRSFTSFWTRSEGDEFGRGNPGVEHVMPCPLPTNWHTFVARIIAECLSTGRTVECGAGIGMHDWMFEVRGRPADYSWDHLVSEIDGNEEKTRDVPWDLNPDYQRPGVWTTNQQEQFIGHRISGGETPLIYVQRYDSERHAPKGSNYLDLPIEVIDGQQRLRAICRFIKGEIGAQVFHDGEWHLHHYEDMNERERNSLRLSSRIVFVDIPRTDRLRFYLRLNSGVAHTEAELDRVRKMLIEEGAE